MFMSAPAWEKEGRAWPNRAASRFVEVGGLRWHVQVLGEGPALLLLHGTGAATHSWRDLLPLLARTHRVIAPDLPGHGFTARPAGFPMTMEGMGEGLRDLLGALGEHAHAIIGHSAGAAIALRMHLNGLAAPRALIAINGALAPFPGAFGGVAHHVTRLFFLNPFVVGMFARRAAQPGAVERLMRSTGSRIDAEGLAHYAALLRTDAQIAGALSMMAHWDLAALDRDLDKVRAPLTLIVGENDRAIPPAVAEAVRARLPQASIEILHGLGHLAHEERPADAAALIQAALA